MAHLSAGDQFSPEGTLLGDAEMIVDRLADDRSIDVISPPVTNKMFYSAHHPFLIDQDAQKYLPFKGDARLTDCPDGLYGSR
jgi:hypothetical protein